MIYCTTWFIEKQKRNNNTDFWFQLVVTWLFQIHFFMVVKYSIFRVLVAVTRALVTVGSFPLRIFANEHKSCRNLITRLATTRRAKPPHKKWQPRRDPPGIATRRTPSEEEERASSITAPLWSSDSPAQGQEACSFPGAEVWSLSLSTVQSAVGQ